MKGYVKGAAIALLFLTIVFGAQQFVASQNEAYRITVAKSQAHQSDLRMCRLQLGIDKPDFHFRPLMMACAHEVTIKADKHGGNRIPLFNQAWKTCMPEMNTCERALSLN